MDCWARAMSDEVPKSIATRELGPSTRMQVWNRPPLPNESPLPTNRTVTAIRSPIWGRPGRPPPRQRISDRAGAPGGLTIVDSGRHTPIMRVVAPPLSHRAAGVLRQVFGGVAAAFAFRLWDGTLVALRPRRAGLHGVIHAPDTFIRLMRDPTPLNFAEAYVGGALDIEGDLFAA